MVRSLSRPLLGRTLSVRVHHGAFETWEMTVCKKIPVDLGLVARWL
jgi:hypothetical protein